MTLKFSAGDGQHHDATAGLLDQPCIVGRLLEQFAVRADEDLFKNPSPEDLRGLNRPQAAAIKGPGDPWSAEVGYACFSVERARARRPSA